MKPSLSKTALLILAFLTIHCHAIDSINAQEPGTKETAEKPARVKVLNFGTFHMGQTSDSISIKFDPVAQKQEVHDIAKQLAEFKPTVIVVERPPEKDAEVKAEYQAYLKDPDMKFDYVSEVQLLAYEVGRLSGTTRIHGIDHKMEYNYAIGGQLDNEIDQKTCIKFAQSIPEMMAKTNGLTTLEKLKLFNSEEALNFALFANADVLSHIGTNGEFEGADEAAKFYKRNLRMYSNLNRLALSKEDRVFVLLGATHTAFLRDFLSRSPKYEPVECLPFLER